MKKKEAPMVVAYTSRRGVFVGTLVRAERIGETDTWDAELRDARMVLYVPSGGFIGLASAIPPGTRTTPLVQSHVDTLHGWTVCTDVVAAAWRAVK